MGMKDILKADVGTQPRVTKAAPALKHFEKGQKKREAGELRRRIDVMKAAGIPDKHIEAEIRKEFARRDEVRRRQEAARKLGTPP
jgi:hypothetical protein